REGSAPPALTDVARWTLQAAEALAHAHQRGIVHRDITPSNLLLDREGTLWVTDFGLARRADDVTWTDPGAVMGPPLCMSPEQARGNRKTVDHRTDLYSLGATLYQLITGVTPFGGSDNVEILQQQVIAEATPPRRRRPDCPRDLETICLKCLQKDPDKRY